MSTNDVPGANPVNRDELHVGCWAEHEDGSLILVLGAENQQIVYHIFDTAKDPAIEYRDAMDEKGFKDLYSWKPNKKDSIKWTWHDKTPFPWKRIMKDFPDGPMQPDAGRIMTAAARIAERLGLTGKATDPRDYRAHAEELRPAGRGIWERLGRALDRELGR